MNFTISQIQKSKKSKTLICICINTIDWNKRIIGYVTQIYLSDKFELQVIDEYGQEKNIKTILFNSIKSLEIGGTYNSNLERLNKKKFVRKQGRARYISAKSQNLNEKLRDLKGLKTLCTFFFKTEFSIGIVTRVTKNEIGIKNITYEGQNDGISIFDIASLTKIRLGSDFEDRIAFLFNKH